MDAAAPGPDGALAADVVADALRRVDRDALAPVLAALVRGELPPESAALVPDAATLGKFLMARKGSGNGERQWRRRRLWRRLTETLEGRRPEAALLDGLDEASVASLSDLVKAALNGAKYGGLSYPLKPGEASAIHHIAQEALPSAKTKVLPQEKAPAPIPRAVNDDQVLAHANKASLVNTVAQRLGLKLAKGQAARIAETLGPLWAPATYDDVKTAVVAHQAMETRMTSTAKAVRIWLAHKHGIPPEIAEPFARRLATSNPWQSEPSSDQISEAVSPHLASLIRQGTIMQRRLDLTELSSQRKKRFFAEDLSSVDEDLVHGRVHEALVLLEDLKVQRIRRTMVDEMGVQSADVIAERALAGDKRPATLVGSMIPIAGATLATAAKAAAYALGADRDGAERFAAALKEGARLSAERSAAESKRLYEWERSLLDADGARAVLKATKGEFSRWVDEGLIPVAKSIAFRKWGSDLITRRYDPVELKRVMAHVGGWRKDHAAGMASKRRASAQKAAAARKASRAAAAPDPAAIRRRRLVALIRSANAHDRVSIQGDMLAVRVPLTIRGGTPWPTSFGMKVPETTEDTLRGEKPATGKVRREALNTLSEALSDATRIALDGMLAVLSPWEERAAKVEDGFEGSKAITFRVSLARRIDAEADRIVVSETRASSELAPELARALDAALASTVSALAMEWRGDDLKVRSGLADYAGMFPEARAIERRLVLNLGPTNSGKTHAAMDLLAKAVSGAYLAPLRLMALEGAERMNGERGVITNMVTGEEIVTLEGAHHVSSTIEMADLSKPIDVAVIDEIQMVSDRDRGWAWTQAVIGIPARTVVMTGSVDALPFVTRMARMTGDKLEVNMFERLTPLRALDRPVSIGSIREGDAVVAFSRSEVLRLRDEFAGRGLSVATIYGALGPEVRKVEAQRFRSGEASVLVATDAIAMGLNLPIHRVLLSATSKWDGVSTRNLTDSEIRQICGRAGRYGISEGGEAGVLGEIDPAPVKRALASIARPPSDDRLPVMPPWAAVQAVSEALGTEDLEKLLHTAAGSLLKGMKDLRAPSLDDPLAVAAAIKDSGLPLRQRFRYLGCPIDSRDGGVVRLLGKWAAAHAAGQSVPSPTLGRHSAPDDDFGMAECERAAKLLTAYLWLALRWPASFTGYGTALSEREKANGFIEAVLRRKSIGRSCKRCGSKLGKKHRFPICDGCFRGGRY